MTALSTPRWGRWLAAVAVLVVIGAHLGFGATVVTHWGLTASALAAVLAVKLAAVAAVRVIRRRRHRREATDDDGDLARSHRRLCWHQRRRDWTRLRIR